MPAKQSYAERLWTAAKAKKAQLESYVLRCRPMAHSRLRGKLHRHKQQQRERSARRNERNATERGPNRERRYAPLRALGKLAPLSTKRQGCRT